VGPSERVRRPGRAASGGSMSTRISLDEVDVQLDTVHVATIADLAGDRPGDVTRSAPEVDDDVRSSPSSWPPSG
jgi:hypothetical protein